MTLTIASLHQLYSPSDLALVDNYIAPPLRIKDDQDAYGSTQPFQGFLSANDYLEQQEKAAAEYMFISRDMDFHAQHRFPEAAA